MKRIIFFSKNLNIGGMEKALVNLLNALASEYEITLVLEEKCGPLLDNLKNNIKVEEYKLSKIKVAPLRKAINLFKRTLWSIKNKNNYDFSCNYATYSIIGSRLSQIASTNSALYVHSDYFELYHHNKEVFKRFFDQHLINNFSHIVFVSKESKIKFIKIYPNLKPKVKVINNLIDEKRIKELSNIKSDFNIDKKNKNFIFVGRLENESKNLDLLIDSFSLVLKKDKNIRLYIIGDGRYKGSLQHRISQNNLEKYILCLGEKENPYSYMNKCDSMILTSNYEGFPVVYLEALVLNKPIMSTILVSDESVNMKDYIICLKPDKIDISNQIFKFEKKEVKYNLDFKKINNNKIKKVIEMIEV